MTASFILQFQEPTRQRMLAPAQAVLTFTETREELQEDGDPSVLTYTSLSANQTMTQTLTREEPDQAISFGVSYRSVLTKTSEREEPDQEESPAFSAIPHAGTITLTRTREEDDQDMASVAVAGATPTATKAREQLDQAESTLSYRAIPN